MAIERKTEGLKLLLTRSDGEHVVQWKDSEEATQGQDFSLEPLNK